MSLLESLILFLTVSRIYGTLTTEYYKNLILKNVAEAEKYELPQDNAEFKIGIESSDIRDFGSYDFIIVGAGSAGSVLATRLSEIRDWNILLLEAGDEENDFSVIPNIFFYLQFTEKNWGYQSTPQKNVCLGMKDNKCMVPRGKSIGGTSAINGGFYSRGNSKDYDRWAELGNPGWSYRDVFPYFMKSENSQIDGDPTYHGTGGFWNVQHPPVSDQFKTLMEGSIELNQSVVDYNGKRQIGVSKSQIIIKRGKRQSSGTAFLDNARHRKNLKVVTKALVTKINIDTDEKAAQGVEFVTQNIKYFATAAKEVIVSAGAINSPQLLILSGIGPKVHLEELGIHVVADLPVGENLLDHPLFPIFFHTNSSLEFDDMDTAINKYLNGLGYLTSPSNLEATGFIPAKEGPEDIPMLQYMFITPSGSESNVTARIYNYKDELTYNYLQKCNPKTDISFFLLLLHQKSRGRIYLKSQNPLDFPNIDLNLLSDTDDVNHVIDGIEFILKLSQTPAFQKINTSLVEIPICDEHEKYSRAYWTCAIHHVSMSGYHLAGTTMMGPDTSTSVVDHNLKVHGIEKLRIVDAGVFPSSISGPTYVPTVMVAEKISDVIKKYYGSSTVI